MKKFEEGDNEREHKGPPFSWDEIEDSMKRKSHSAKGRTRPDDTPKCLECLQPMEWIYFESPPGTWKHLCRCAGWTASAELAKPGSLAAWK